MGRVRALALLSPAAGCASLLACGPVDSVTINPGGAPRLDHPPVAREGGEHAPPPWVPRSGDRRRHQHADQSRQDAVDLVFDNGLGVHLVVGIPNDSYWDGVYLRLEAGNWWRARYLDARSPPCLADALPGNLRWKPVEKYNGPPKGRGDDYGLGNDDDHGHGKGHGRGHSHRNGDEDEDDSRSEGLAPLERVALRFPPATEDPLVVNASELALDLVEHLIGSHARRLRIGMRRDIGVLARSVPVHAEARAVLGDRQLESAHLVKLIGQLVTAAMDGLSNRLIDLHVPEMQDD
jgi:hypothetical protein